MFLCLLLFKLNLHISCFNEWFGVEHCLSSMMMTYEACLMSIDISTQDSRTNFEIDITLIGI